MVYRKARSFCGLPRKLTSALVILAFFLFSTFAFNTPSYAGDDTMEHTLRSTIYGGIIGGLLGTAVMLVSDNPDNNLSYIPTGAGIGLLLGAAYGLASSGIIYSSAIETDGDTLAFHLPEVQRLEFYDENTQEEEVINKIDIFRVRF